jgi:hypothetical protein
MFRRAQRHFFLALAGMETSEIELESACSAAQQCYPALKSIYYQGQSVEFEYQL